MHERAKVLLKHSIQDLGLAVSFRVIRGTSLVWFHLIEKALAKTCLLTVGLCWIQDCKGSHVIFTPYQ